MAALFAYGNFYFNVIALVMALLLLGNTFNFDVQMIRVMLIAHLQNYSAFKRSILHSAICVEQD